MSIAGAGPVRLRSVVRLGDVPPSQKQLDALEKYGIYPNEIENAGKAAMLLDRLNKRRMDGTFHPEADTPAGE